MAAGQGLLLGVDIGGTKTHMALGRADGALLREAHLEDWTSGDVERDLAKISTTARGLLAAAGVEASALEAIGISAPGPLDPVTGVIRDAPNLPGWHEGPIRARLEGYDLVPNLVETVKGYAAHEKSVLENVTMARSAAMKASTPSDRAKA